MSQMIKIIFLKSGMLAILSLEWYMRMLRNKVDKSFLTFLIIWFTLKGGVLEKGKLNMTNLLLHTESMMTHANPWHPRMPSSTGHNVGYKMYQVRHASTYTHVLFSTYTVVLNKVNYWQMAYIAYIRMDFLEWKLSLKCVRMVLDNKIR